MLDLFADFNGLPDKEAVTEFYQHEANWSNRMILGDSLQVMASLAEREGLRGKVQCIYIDPPYGIRFNSNFQWSTTSRDVKDGNPDHITREPEQVKAFRDTWRDGVHSYLTYLRDRLTVARELLAESGSIFVQISDENVHRVRALMDEIFGDENFVAILSFWKTSSLGSEFIDNTFDYLLWFSKARLTAKFRRLYWSKALGGQGASQYDYEMLAPGYYKPIVDFGSVTGKVFAHGDMRSQSASESTLFPIHALGLSLTGPAKGGWKTNQFGMQRLLKANRLIRLGNTFRYVRYFDDHPVYPMTATWSDTGISGFGNKKVYVVQTLPAVVERCILMTTDPGDLVLDPTCGSGTTTYIAEQWGRRWITIDTSRVALALARARIMGARYPYYLLADSPEGQLKEAEVSGTPPKQIPTHNDTRHGFVYERVPHITLKSIANNAEIEVIWEKWQKTLEPLRAQINAALGNKWEEWEIPREAGDPWPEDAAKLWTVAKGNNSPAQIQKAIAAINRTLDRSYTRDTLPDAPRDPWPEEPTRLHSDWWAARTARQKEIDASIAAKAEFEYLYDKPYIDNSRVRVAGPFTVESLSPHRVVAADQDDSLIHGLAEPNAGWQDFGQMVLENLKTAGVQQAHKEDRISFTSLTPWPGKLISAEGRYSDGHPLPNPPPPCGGGKGGG